MELIHLLQVIELSEYWLTALKNNVIWILLQIEDDFTKIKAVWIYRIRSDYVTRLWSWIKLLCKLYFISVFSLRLTLSFFYLKLTSVEWQNIKIQLTLLHLKHSYYHAKLSKTICSHWLRYYYEINWMRCDGKTCIQFNRLWSVE